MSQIQVYNTGGGGGGGSDVRTLTGNSGGAVGPTANNINVVGSGGVVVTGNPGTSTLTITVAGTGFTWTDVTGSTQALLAENGYFSDSGTLITFTLPATGTLGDTIKIVGKGAGFYRIAQNAGQTIHFVTASTTTGTAGSLTSTEQYDAITIVCSVANTDWTVESSTGNFTVA